MKPETTTVYLTGHSDGYTHTYGGPLYRSYAEAKAAGIARHGAYAVDPIPREAIVLEDGSAAYLIELGAGPVKFAEAVELEKVMRKAILAKLTEDERRILGLADE